MAKNQSVLELKLVPSETNSRVPSEQEAEARLHREGYESFRWYDVPGASYPNHRHSYDECIWVLKGEIVFKVGETEFQLKPGDRLYLPAKTAHTAIVPNHSGVTYLVGEFKDPAS
jgi:quercetin dioxygenase-like cupin family protein